MWHIVSSQFIYFTTFFSLFSVFLFFFKETSLFPVPLSYLLHLVSLPRDIFDCMPSYLFIHSCAAQCFIVTCWWCLSPEILHRSIQQPPKDLFRRWAFRSLQALDFGKWQLNLSLPFKSNDTTIFQYQSHDVSYQKRGILLIEVCVMMEPYSAKLESVREEPSQLYTRRLRRGSAVGVSHSSCVASLLPAAVAGWCLRCLRGGPCPRYSSTWLWVSQSEPFVYADRIRWLLTWKKWPRRVVL